MNAAKKRPIHWQLLHWTIILNLVFQMGYAAYMVFFVVTPESSGPLFEAAKTFPFEQMVTRRLYAIEFWIATGAFSLYLGLTEIFPRFWSLSPTPNGS